jgi:hypothetical protein
LYRFQTSMDWTVEMLARHQPMDARTPRCT